MRDISLRAYIAAWMAVIVVFAIISVNLPAAQSLPVFSMMLLLLYMSFEQDRADIENHLLREHFRAIEVGFRPNNEEEHADDLEAAIIGGPSEAQTGDHRCSVSISVAPIFDIRSNRREDIENKWKLLDNFKSYDIKYSSLSDIAAANNPKLSSVVPALKRQDRQLVLNPQRSAIDLSHRNYWIELLNDESDVP